MKNYLFLILFFSLGIVQNAKAQSCDEMLKAAKAEEAKGEYFRAYQKYEAALNNCGEGRKDEIKKLKDNAILALQNLKNEAIRQKENALNAEEKAKEAQKTTEKALVEVEKQKNTAQNEKLKADSALVETGKAKELAQNNLDKANKLVNAFYFYEGRFALALKRESGNNKLYFIDKNGDKVEKLGEWDKIDMFDENFNKNGLAKVWNNNTEYYLDTLGNSYSIAYSLKTLNEDTKALDLTDVTLKEFPLEILNYENLEVLLLGSSMIGAKQIANIPKQIGKLKKLKIIQLNACNLKELPSEIINLPNLYLLDLRGNDLTALPYEMQKNTKLKILKLDDCRIKLLPNTIENLQNLEYLGLWSNMIEELPNSISNLNKLNQITLSDNVSLNISKTLSLLSKFNKNIAIVHPLHNYEKYISKRNTILVSLPYMEHIPIEVIELSNNLVYLDMTVNFTGSISDKICTLKKLNFLSFFNTRIQFMPDCIKELIELRYLDLRGNYFSKEEQEKIRKLLPNCEVEF